MTPRTLGDPQDSSSVESGDGVGRRLRAARLDRGLDLERIAAQIKVRPALVDALEAGRYEELPAPVFVSGYIRNYARQVGLDSEPLIAAYHSAQGQAEAARPWTQAGVTPSDLGGGTLVRLMTIAVILGLGFLFFQWWQNLEPPVPDLVGEPLTLAPGIEPAAPGLRGDNGSQDHKGPAGQERSEEGNPGPLAAPQAESAAPTLHPVPLAVPADTEPDAPGAAPTPATPPEALAGSAPATVSEAPAQATQHQGDVVLEFRGPCWVDVRDAAKSFSLTGEMGRGDRRVLGGSPPYSLILGNASAVAITVKGAPYDLARVTKGNVARFKLDPDNLP
jgi:cytoskeleton protein RodZ